METAYRSTSSNQSRQLSSDEGEIHSDSDSDSNGPLWSNKRTKNDGANGMIAEPVTAQQSLHQRQARTKNANMWGAVLIEQNSSDISSSFGAVGMQYRISRGPESFDLPRECKESASSESEEERKSNTTKKQVTKGQKSHRKRKKPRGKNNVPAYEPGQSIKLNKRCELSDTDPVDKVAEEIAFRLWERKRNLIRSLTEVLGVPKTIDFYNKTENIEKSGGLMIMNGKRRRTPGGTFLYLVRNDPKVDQEPIKRVFELEAEKEKLLWDLKKTAKTDHCDNMEAKDSRDPGQEANCVEMPISNEASIEQPTKDDANLLNQNDGGEFENPAEDVDTFG